MADNFRVVPLMDRDVPELEGILRQHVRYMKTGNIALDEVKSFLSYMHGLPDPLGRIRTYIVAKGKTGRVLGCMAYTTPEDDVIKLAGIQLPSAYELVNAFVEENVQRKGIGKKLFDTVCKTAKRDGKYFIVLRRAGRDIKKAGRFMTRYVT